MSARPLEGLRSPTVDLHVHPTMKTYLANQQFTHETKVDSGFNPFELRCNYPSLLRGEVDLICSAVYVPEAGLIQDCPVIDRFRHFLPKLNNALTTSPLATATKMLQHMESWVQIVNAGHPPRRMTSVTSRQQLDAALTSGELAVVHTLEGAHVLESDIANLDHFHQIGVAMLTLAHFYPNGVAPPVEAIPADMFLRGLGCFTFEEDLTLGLTPLGRDVVARMLEIGMIVDLTHSTPRARVEALDICRGSSHRRPMIMSHVGYWPMCRQPMNPDHDEVVRIADTGGVIGVIFYNYWLTVDPHPDTLAHVVDTIVSLVKVAGEEGVALGSDWDGMTDPPDDLREPADWPRLAAALRARGLTQSVVEKVSGLNAIRVLRDGWG